MTGERYHTRTELAKKYTLDPAKRWISIFAYPETLKQKIKFDTIPDDICIFLFDAPTMHPQEGIVTLPIVDVYTYYSILRASDWSIIR